MISLFYPLYIRGIFLYVAIHISVLFPIKLKENKNILQVELLEFKPVVYILLFRFQKDCPHALCKEGTYHVPLLNGHWYFSSAFIYTPWFNKYKHLKIFWISFSTKIYVICCPDACLTATLPYAKVSVFKFLLKWTFLKYWIGTVAVKVPFVLLPVICCRQSRSMPWGFLRVPLISYCSSLPFNAAFHFVLVLYSHTGLLANWFSLTDKNQYPQML